MLIESGALNANDSAIDAEFIELDDSKWAAMVTWIGTYL